MKRPLSQVDDNLNFFLIYFHVLCLPFLFFFFYLLPLFYFTSPGVSLSSLRSLLPSLPTEAHYLGTEPRLLFNTAEL